MRDLDLAARTDRLPLMGRVKGVRMQDVNQPRGEAEVVIARESLATKIAAKLREWILLELLKPGAIVTERELAERLGVSRTPMREALRILAEEELIDMQVNRRPRIAKPSLERVCDLLDVLSSLETLAVRLCVERATADEVAEIANIQRQLQRLTGRNQPLDFFNADMSVHHAIVAASHNAPLISTHRQITAAVFRARFLASRNPDWRAATLQEHDDLVDAILRRRAEDAVSAVQRHLMSVRTHIAALFPAFPQAEGAGATPPNKSAALLQGSFGRPHHTLPQPLSVMSGAPIKGRS